MKAPDTTLSLSIIEFQVPKPNKSKIQAQKPNIDSLEDLLVRMDKQEQSEKPQIQGQATNRARGQRTYSIDIYNSSKTGRKDSTNQNSPLTYKDDTPSHQKDKLLQNAGISTLTRSHHFENFGEGFDSPKIMQPTGRQSLKNLKNVSDSHSYRPKPDVGFEGLDHFHFDSPQFPQTARVRSTTDPKGNYIPPSQRLSKINLPYTPKQQNQDTSPVIKEAENEDASPPGRLKVGSQGFYEATLKAESHHIHHNYNHREKITIQQNLKNLVVNNLKDSINGNQTERPSERQSLFAPNESPYIQPTATPVSRITDNKHKKVFTLGNDSELASFKGAHNDLLLNKIFRRGQGDTDTSVGLSDSPLYPSISRRSEVNFKINHLLERAGERTLRSSMTYEHPL